MPGLHPLPVSDPPRGRLRGAGRPPSRETTTRALFLAVTVSFASMACMAPLGVAGSALDSGAPPLSTFGTLKDLDTIRSFGTVSSLGTPSSLGTTNSIGTVSSVGTLSSFGAPDEFSATGYALGASSTHSTGSFEPTRESAAFWIFFADRGEARLDADATREIAGSLPAEAWARRARSSAMLPDERDLPVWEPYVVAVGRLGEIRYESRWLNAVSVDVDRSAIEGLAALPFVKEVRPVATGQTSAIEPAGILRLHRGSEEQPSGTWPYGASWGQLDEIGVPPVHALGYSGNRVRMMMIDSGFRKDHEAFAQVRLLGERDFVFGDDNVQNEPEDDENAHVHGTLTWGAAGGYAPGDLIGPGYGASFYLAKTEDIRSETRIEEDWYVAALEWADSLGVVLTSASLVYFCFDDGFCYNWPLKDGDTAVITRAVDVAASRGILCVNGMGNRGDADESITTPADADSIVAVGAVDSLNQIADFSSHGPSDDGRTKPEVVARGVSTWCSYADATDAYGPASGTSLSTPLVAGAAALLMEAHPEWGPMDVRDALMMTADRSEDPDNYYGWGRIDVAAALEWRPVLYPSPFSLLLPGDGSTVPGLVPTFQWNASHDPDVAEPLDYTVHLRETAPGGDEWLVEAGGDTTLILPFVLEPATEYEWDVLAEDVDGYRRTSRETFRFLTPSTSGMSGPTVASPSLRLTLAPNPFDAVIRFEVAVADVGVSGRDLRWAVYDPLGRRQAHGSCSPSAGVYVGSWNGTGAAGAPAPAGIYYLEVRSRHQAIRRAIVRLARD